MPVLIREFSQGDAAAVALTFFRSVRESGLRHYSEQQVQAWAPDLPEPSEICKRMENGRVCLVAEQNGRIVGYGDLEANGHIDHLYCLPEACGQGVASELLKHLTSIAASRCLPRLFVEASAAAHGLFKRHGFRTGGRRDFEIRGVPICNYAMEKALYPVSPARATMG